MEEIQECWQCGQPKDDCIVDGYEIRCGDCIDENMRGAAYLFIWAIPIIVIAFVGMITSVFFG